MNVFLAVVGTLLGLFVAFVFWRYTSVARGARQRDLRILPALDPIASRLQAKQPVSAEEIEALAATNYLRPLLYQMLSHFQKLELFPAKYLDSVSQGEARLAYWMMHPNELQDPAVEIQLLETIRRDIPGGNGAFHVYRYRMAPGHWSGDGWQLGLSGPYIDGDPPYLNIAGAFSRAGDEEGEVVPAELVDWYIGIVLRKAGIDPDAPAA